jgi:hypothetical protein
MAKNQKTTGIGKIVYYSQFRRGVGTPCHIMPHRAGLYQNQQGHSGGKRNRGKTWAKVSTVFFIGRHEQGRKGQLSRLRIG